MVQILVNRTEITLAHQKTKERKLPGNFLKGGKFSHDLSYFLSVCFTFNGFALDYFTSTLSIHM